MRKLVPFKKDIVFDTRIDEINSISLEYEVGLKEDGLISGKFIISGDYKMASSSMNLDSFNYELPFNINIDKKYYINDAEVDINDFYYEVVNNKILSVNIELAIDKIEEKVVEEEDTKMTDRCIEIEEDVSKDNMDKQEELFNEINENANNNFTNLFESMDDNENYITYKVHIVRENDTIDSIMMDYQVTKEQLANYNNLSDVQIGDKLIVPANEN